MLPVNAHPVPAGPLAVRWHGYDLPARIRAGDQLAVAVRVENAGTQAWYPGGRAGQVQLSYHWLDLRGNPIVWDGMRTPAPALAPGQRGDAVIAARAPFPPGTYRLAIDAVCEGVCWFADVGNTRLEVETDVRPWVEEHAFTVVPWECAPRDVERAAAAIRGQGGEVAADGPIQLLARPGCEPADGWVEHVLAAHRDGYAVAAGSVSVQGDLRRRMSARRRLQDWQPGFGRVPGWSLPLLCPTVAGMSLDTVPWIHPIQGLPTLDPSWLNAPWICDGRITMLVRAS